MNVCILILLVCVVSLCCVKYSFLLACRPFLTLEKIQIVSKVNGSVISYTAFCLLQRIVKDRDEEREQLCHELQRSREQLHVLLESDCQNQLNASSTPSHLQPSSLILQEGPCEPHHSSEDDAG